MVGPTGAISWVRTCAAKIKYNTDKTKNEAMDEALVTLENFPDFLFVLYVSS